MSYKNLLQEYCQKNGKGTPIYTLKDHVYQREGNINEFKCNVTCFYGEATSNFQKTKKEAEMDAAQKILDQIKENLQNQQTVSSNNSFTPYQSPAQLTHIILIDIENRPKMVKLPYIKTAHRVGFISKYSNHAENDLDLGQWCELKVIESAASNAADIAMVFHAGEINQAIKTLGGTRPQIIVVTRDKFGGPLQKLFEENGLKTHMAMIKRDLEKLGVLIND